MSFDPTLKPSCCGGGGGGCGTTTDCGTHLSRLIADLKLTAREVSEPAKCAPSPCLKTEGPPVSIEEIRALFSETAPITAFDLVTRFKQRVNSPQEKKAFTRILMRISKIEKKNGQTYFVLRSNFKRGGAAAKVCTVKNKGPISEEEIRALLSQKPPITAVDLKNRFTPRFKSLQDKKACVEILKRIAMIQKKEGQYYVVLKSNDHKILDAFSALCL